MLCVPYPPIKDAPFVPKLSAKSRDASYTWVRDNYNFDVINYQKIKAKVGVRLVLRCDKKHG